MQVKLLRVVQEKSVRPVGAQHEIPTDVRLLSASHKNLADEVSHHRFRQDLYYRINVIELAVPSLRERQEDIPAIAAQLLARLAEENGLSSPPSISDEALTALCHYGFPGNVRELENILQRAMTLSENKRITLETLDLMPTSITTAPTTAASDTPPKVQEELLLGPGFSLEHHLEEIERRAINQALMATRWNKTAAAQLLGMSFRSLRYRMKKLGMD